MNVKYVNLGDAREFICKQYIINFHHIQFTNFNIEFIIAMEN